MNYPEYVKIENKEYKINTDFRVAIECNEIALDKSIRDYERALAIIYKLFGEDGLNDFDNHGKLLELGQKYLACGKELPKEKDEPDMDFNQDMDFIEASFMSDYHIDLSNVKMHWWKFNNLINGLSNSEMGNCCILNKIRNIRNCNLKDIKDKKEREQIIKLKEQFSLKRNEKINNITDEQKKSMEDFNKMIGL